MGGLPIHAYGVFVALAIAGGAAVAVWVGVRAGILATYLWDIALIVLFGGVAGARLEYVRTHLPVFVADPLKVFALRDGGLVFYGGLIVVIVGFTLYCRWRGLRPLQIIDIYAMILPFSHALGRLGCFMNGCCFGGLGRNLARSRAASC